MSLSPSAQQPGKPKPPGNPPLWPDEPEPDERPDVPPPAEEPPPPIPTPPIDVPPPSIERVLQVYSSAID